MAESTQPQINRLWDPNSKFRTALRLWIGLIMLGFLLVSWFVSSVVVCLQLESPSNMQTESVTGFFYGLYLSRWAVVALLVVMLPGGPLIRIALAMMLFAGEVVLMAISVNSMEPFAICLMLPTVVFGFALPFEAARVVWHTRLTADWFDQIDKPRLGLKGLFIRMTAIAVMLGAIRLCDQEFALSLVGIAFAMILLGTILFLPFTIKFMRTRYRVTCFLLFFLGWISITVTLVGGIGILVNNFDVEVLAASGLFVGAILASYGLALAILIRMGFQLESNRYSTVRQTGNDRQQ